MKRIYDQFESFISFYVIGVFICGMALLIFADVFLRFVFNAPIRGSSEIVELSMVLVSFGGVAGVQRLHRHIRMDFLQIHFRGTRTGHVLESILLSVCLATYLVLLVPLYQFTMQQKASGSTTQYLYLPLWPVFWIMIVGIALLAIRLAIQLGEEIVTLRKGQPKPVETAKVTERLFTD